ncbi:MAG: hypothetical protein ACOH1Y_07045 [Propionicimonas sp.]
MNEVFQFVTTDVAGGPGAVWTYRKDGAPVVSRSSFGPAPGTAMDKTTVRLDFKVEPDYRFLDNKKLPITAHLKRAISYTMDRDGAKWLIKSWKVKQSATITDG